MVIASRKNAVEECSVLKKIKAEGKVDKEWEVTVQRATATLECEGFKSLMALWTKL